MVIYNCYLQLMLSFELVYQSLCYTSSRDSITQLSCTSSESTLHSPTVHELGCYRYPYERIGCAKEQMGVRMCEGGQTHSGREVV